ncbi:GGDEF domain-containing protein [Photobacterium proteolyticum]|uniref:GGDEF domain-containing protein n=1 Tax=Photobacterium proteolyticum TaxID=1903952 RepID=UPI0009FB1245|nr:GGDEF domain-containing protein [Photobacterium proteolyticum]
MAVKLILFLLFSLPLLAWSKEEPIVLLVNSYHPQYQWTTQQTQGIKDVLIDTVHAENLHIEYMDERRFVDDEVYHTKLIELLKHKYQVYEPDLIMTTDDHAYNFMIENGKDLFPGKPVVYSGVNVPNTKMMARHGNIIGIAEGMEIEGNLDMILQLQPRTMRIIMLSDTTGLGLNMGKKAREIKAQWQADPHKKHVTLEVWDQFSIPELYQRAETADFNSVFLMLAIHKDKLGTYFSYEHHLPLLTQKSKVPVYGMWGTIIIGYGGLGGLMNNPYEHGKNAAKIAIKVLDGVPLKNIKVPGKAHYSPYFDYHQLKRFGIDLSRLPAPSTVINRPVSLYDEHAKLINSTIALFIFMLVVISILTINIKRRITAQRKLHQFNQELESIVQQRTKDLDERNKELQAASKILRAHAYTDELTGLPNRRAASREIVAHIKRYNMDFQPLAVAILDIDLFKSINDTYGHQAGDEVLCAVGETLKETLRPNDRVYRWGGEEFLIVLPDTKKGYSAIVCQRLTKSISQLDISNIGTITASIGVSNFTKGDSFEAILQRADTALYTAKNSGRNQVAAS